MPTKAATTVINFPISDTESFTSFTQSISDEEDKRLSLVTLTEVHLPEVKQLPSPMIGPNFGCASNAHSLSITTGFYSAKNKLDDDGLDFQYEDSRPSSPDTLHTPDKPFQRHGPSRYIFEDGEQGFAAGSKRGWLNFSKPTSRSFYLLSFFVRSTHYKCFLKVPSS
ncbi:hypothetical protein PSHT_11491 [Puccinia striiformis]|uniref:Uncharacterized protein n=1 Tax=Puccinia striiformis TaxID=27350 RepID=A0A2S4V2Y3_9BASI|nr:hypothetical protein PSHT_11491 [Puccinia striiformis]